MHAYMHIIGVFMRQETYIIFYRKFLIALARYDYWRGVSYGLSDRKKVRLKVHVHACVNSNVHMDHLDSLVLAA